MLYKYSWCHVTEIRISSGSDSVIRPYIQADDISPVLQKILFLLTWNLKKRVCKMDDDEWPSSKPQELNILKKYFQVRLYNIG